MALAASLQYLVYLTGSKLVYCTGSMSITGLWVVQDESWSSLNQKPLYPTYAESYSHFYSSSPKFFKCAQGWSYSVRSEMDVMAPIGISPRRTCYQNTPVEHHHQHTSPASPGNPFDSWPSHPFGSRGPHGSYQVVERYLLYTNYVMTTSLAVATKSLTSQVTRSPGLTDLG